MVQESSLSCWVWGYLTSAVCFAARSGPVCGVALQELDLCPAPTVMGGGWLLYQGSPGTHALVQDGCRSSPRVSDGFSHPSRGLGPGGHSRVLLGQASGRAGASGVRGARRSRPGSSSSAPAGLRQVGAAPLLVAQGGGDAAATALHRAISGCPRSGPFGKRGIPEPRGGRGLPGRSGGSQAEAVCGWWPREQELVGFSPLHKSPWAEGAAARRMLDEFQEEKPPLDQLPIRRDAPALLVGPNLHFCREKARREQARSWSWLPEPLPRTFPIKELITERAAKLPVVVRAALAACGLGGSLFFFFLIAG